MDSKTLRPPEIKYRADIDGLRAVAVLAVIGFHAYPKLIPGGFTGVDVFFVISGFLISALILNRLKRKEFSWIDFYARRVRRIFPALILVLLTVLGVGWFAMLPTEFLSLGKHTLASAGFSANILNYLEAGYFDAPASSKPLLHIWSLGVEEQFYAVFPPLLLLGWRRRLLIPALALTGIASFALNILLVNMYPSFTFYIPLTRFWEFIAGAALAVIDFENRNAGSRKFLTLSALQWCNFSAVAGILLIVCGFAISKSVSFPGWWALLPVLGTFFLIGAGPQAWLNKRILAKPLFVFIGLISYPLYLWHWPLLVMGGTIMEGYGNKYSRTITILAIVVTFVLSWLTFQYIERPIRIRRPRFVGQRIAASLLGGMALVALFGFFIMQFDGLPTRYPDEIRALINARDNVNDVYSFGQNMPAKSGAGPMLVAYGDSHAWHLRAGLRRLQSERTFRAEIKSWTLQCVPIVAEVEPAGEETCRPLIANEHKYFQEIKPDIVVISAHWIRYKNIEKLGEILQSFHRIGVPRIVLIGPVPMWYQSPRLMLYRAYKADPLHRVPERLSGFAKQSLEVDRQLQDIASKFGVRYIRSFDVLCNVDTCLARLGDTAQDIIQFDGTHLTAVGSWYFVSRIADKIFD